jgi:hypothetical protein
MFRLGWLLAGFIFILSISVYAQDVIVNPPLSLDPEDGRRIIEREPTDGALVPIKAEVTEDGQLKLEDKKPAVSGPAEKMPEATEQKSAEVKAAFKEPSTVDYLPLEKYLQFSFGYLNSKWEKADPSLENGSMLTDFRVVSDMNTHNQFGFAIELVSDKSSQSAPENIRAVQYKLFLDYHRTLFTDKLDYLYGLAVSIGDYSIRKLELNGSGQEVYSKVKSGTIYGIIPSAGLRFYLVGRNSIDIVVEYHQYLSKPQSYIGGLALVPRFSFVF